MLVLAPMVTDGDRGPPDCEDRPVSANGILELLPGTPPWEWSRVRWRTGLDAGSYRVILVAERDGAASMRKGPFSGRAVFQQDPLSLRISPVLAADAGLYEAEFEAPGGALSPRCFRVSVWEPLQPPHVESLILPEPRGWCNLSLLCTATGAGPVSYSWSCNGDAVMEPGPRLQLRLHAGADPIVCRCNVSNAVSWSSADASASAACTGLFSTFPPWAVALAVAVPVLPIAIALLITCSRRRTRQRDPPGHMEQALTVYEEVGKDQTGRAHSTGGNESTSGESTVYAVICKAQGPSLQREPESRTIYTSVQPSRQSPSLRRKRLDPALVSTAYVEVMGCPGRPPSHMVSPAPPGPHLS
ncbi:natural killer cell receptor 2B4 isoform X1 [Melopsittacus undulatus]|uniref:natural killer cell receptor 2B4 isoform X1 n=1 Tax=Melopsittacus undulatus TaxID=13146 RepID=UPI00146E0421|nr:natural killer cell receptor 2B4 isoform X1 [Melopsittacus undulatus]